MKIKFCFSFLALAFFALLGGGSFRGEDLGVVFAIIVIVLAAVGLVALIVNLVQSNNKEKRLQMIKEDEQTSSDFDRKTFIGDDRCKIYFDASKKKVMIMRVMTEGIKREYIDDFEFPGKDLAIYTGNRFNVYDPTRRKFLSGTYHDANITYEITSIAEKDNNKEAVINNAIPPVLKTMQTFPLGFCCVLIDECHGLIAISETGKVKHVFNYVNANSLSKKNGEKSTISTKNIGRYLFILDDFFKVLVLIGSGRHEIFNYSDIIEVSYVEDGIQLYTKSAGRTVGGAIVGGVLMGGAGAVVGGLSGASKQNKEVKSMDIKLLLRSTNRSSYVLHFNDSNGILKTKEEGDKELYDSYLRSANHAKDIFSVIIDNAKQTSTPIQQIDQPVVTSTAAPSVADELAKLAKLKADGILTEEEFQAQKTKLLNL